MRAAEGGECAADQGKFVAYHDAVYARQRSTGFTDSILYDAADEAGLDMDVFRACYDNRQHAAAVQASFEEGRALGVIATPWVIVNGVHLDFTQLTVETFLDYVRRLLPADAAAGGGS